MIEETTEWDSSQLVNVAPEEFFSAVHGLRLDVLALERFIGPTEMFRSMRAHLDVLSRAHVDIACFNKWLDGFNRLLNGETGIDE